MLVRQNPLEQLPAIAQDPNHCLTLFTAQDFHQQLISAIRSASKRIYLVALYLEDDEAGRELLTELYLAKQKSPQLEIHILVDWHRAQRGLIGAATSAGNACMYCQFAEIYPQTVHIHGVPVRAKELFGVLHLKGFIIDDQVIYSGASLNNVYLHYRDKYRFDRYHCFINQKLADSMVNFIQQNLIASPAVNLLNRQQRPLTKEIKSQIRRFRHALNKVDYQFEADNIKTNQVAITPLVGVGKQRNKLNKIIIQLLQQAKKEIYICTPYFNFPVPIAKAIKKAIRRGVKIHIIVGDKTANDFYIPPNEKFKAIGGLPYLYELNLRRFAKANEAHIASRQLSIHLWKHENHSFHLKGIWVDDCYMLLTGNNLNPRAWKLDLENGLLIRDHQQTLKAQFQAEFDHIFTHTQLVCTYKQIEKLETYPSAVQRLIRRIIRLNADRILKQIL